MYRCVASILICMLQYIHTQHYVLVFTQKVTAGRVCKTTTVKPVFFVCPLFHEFCDIGDAMKKGSQIFKISCYFCVYYLVQRAKMQKLRAPK